MFGKRLRYLVFLLVFGIYYLSSGEWLSWFLLAAMLALPWLSLAVSLPAIRQMEVSTTGPGEMLPGENSQLWLLASSSMPLPPFQGDIWLESIYTGERQRYSAEKGFQPKHCGGLRITVEKPRVFDYMGLFSFRLRRMEEKLLLVRPRPLALKDITLPEDESALAWRPKHGGGFAENHELREYRPGDGLNQVHWKLSAKTGELVIREPMEPLRGLVLVTMTLSGTLEELDRKLGRLSWMGELLLNHHFNFTLRVLTGQGLMSFEIANQTALHRAMDTLLCTPLALSGSIQEQVFAAQWQYHIGGQPDEA